VADPVHAEAAKGEALRTGPSAFLRNEANFPGVGEAELRAEGDRSGQPDHELFAREIEFEERNDAMLHRALDQLGKIKAAKRGITFLEARRFSKTPLRRLRGSK
jgi:hypothetical protein